MKYLLLFLLLSALPLRAQTASVTGPITGMELTGVNATPVAELTYQLDATQNPVPSTITLTLNGLTYRIGNLSLGEADLLTVQLKKY